MGTDSSVVSIIDLSVLSAEGKPQIQINGRGFGNEAQMLILREML